MVVTLSFMLAPRLAHKEYHELEIIASVYQVHLIVEYEIKL